MYNKYTSFLPGSRALLSFPWTRPVRLADSGGRLLRCILDPACLGRLKSAG
jgi:hypothetical protein